MVLGDQVRDPFMFAAVRVADLKASEAFYVGELGMRRLPYPRAREALTSPFEPQQPKGSVYLGYSPDTFGLLLLPRDRAERRRNGPTVRMGEVWGGLRVVTSGPEFDTPG